MRTRAPRPARGGAEAAQPPLVSLAEITEIELRLLKRVRELTLGDHASLFHGTGVDFVGLRDWQAGDRFESIDWPQSSLTNFSPLVVREFEQPSTASVVMIADASLSTRCGAGSGSIARGDAHGRSGARPGPTLANADAAARTGTGAAADGRERDAGGAGERSTAAIIARTIATIGLSAVFFQDSIGLITFDGACERLSGLRPRVGKTQVIHCLDAYQGGLGLEELRAGDSLSASLAGFLRKTSLVPVVSDFLFDNAAVVIGELARLGAMHDVFIALVDAGAAFDLPVASAGWIDAFDIETGRTRLMSRGELSRMVARVRAWQDDVTRTAKSAGLDVVRLSAEAVDFDLALAEFVVERRLRRM